MYREILRLNADALYIALEDYVIKVSKTKLSLPLQLQIAISEEFALKSFSHFLVLLLGITFFSLVFKLIVIDRDSGSPSVVEVVLV